MIDQLVEAAMAYERGVNDEAHHILCFARKWLSEHIEMLCEEAGVEPADTDRIIRYL